MSIERHSQQERLDWCPAALDSRRAIRAGERHCSIVLRDESRIRSTGGFTDWTMCFLDRCHVWWITRRRYLSLFGSSMTGKMTTDVRRGCRSSCVIIGKSSIEKHDADGFTLGSSLIRTTVLFQPKPLAQAIRLMARTVRFPLAMHWRIHRCRSFIQWPWM